MLKNKFVFVADFFSDQVRGGAEMSTQALIDLCPGEVVKIQSCELTREDIDKHKDGYWIFTNTWKMKWALIPSIVHALKYVSVEYDYKYCAYRSPDIHMMAEGMDCNCTNIILDDFYAHADEVFFMSERQRDWFIRKMPFLSNVSVISSLFSMQSLKMIEEASTNEKLNNVWAIVFSGSGLKGFDQAIQYAESNGLDYIVLKDLSYEELISRLSRCRGLIYKPAGGDTCPRLVIEAKLMGLDLDLNYFVQHKDEAWFNSSREDMLIYLHHNKKLFWESVDRYVKEKVSL